MSVYKKMAQWGVFYLFLFNSSTQAGIDDEVLSSFFSSKQIGVIPAEEISRQLAPVARENLLDGDPQSISSETTTEGSISSSNRTPSDSENEYLMLDSFKRTLRGCLKKKNKFRTKKVSWNDAALEVFPIEKITPSDDEKTEEDVKQGSFFNAEQERYFSKINRLIQGANEVAGKKEFLERLNDLRDMLKSSLQVESGEFEKSVLQRALTNIGKTEGRIYSSHGGESVLCLFIEQVQLCAVTKPEPPAFSVTCKDDNPRNTSLIGRDAFDMLFDEALKNKDRGILEVIKESLDPESDEYTQVVVALKASEC